MIYGCKISKPLHGECFYDPAVIIKKRQEYLEYLLALFCDKPQPGQYLRQMPPYFLLVNPGEDI